MKTSTQLGYFGKYGHLLTEITKPQRKIIQVLNLELLYGYNVLGI